MERVVKLAEVDKLAAELNEIAGDWRLFAGQLGVSRGKRKQIAADNAGLSTAALLCLVDALYCWVESSDNPTYDDIVEILTGNVLTNIPLAKEINEKYNLQIVLKIKKTAKHRGVHTRNARAKSAKSDRLRISFLISLVCLLIACLLAVALVWQFDISNEIPSKADSDQVSEQSMCTELENIKLGHQNNATTIEHNLPHLPEKFVGRTLELRRLTHWLLNHKDSGINAVVVYGPPAVGKSTLAIHVGYELRKQGVNVRYINVEESDVFRDSHTDSSVDHSNQPKSVKVSQKSDSKTELTERPSDIDVAGDESPVNSGASSDLLNWARTLQKEYLLVLDNYDFIINKNSLWNLRTASSKLRILITRQRKIKLFDYKLFPLEFLDTESAIELLRHSSSHKHLSDADCRIICEAVDKSPLALKIAAHILSEDTIIEEFIASLQSNVIKVLNEDVGLPENSTLFAVLSSAYNRLSTDKRLCGHYVSNFPSSFDSEVGGQVLKMCLNDSDECLNELVERSLLESYLLANQKRYRFHRLVRAYFRHIHVGESNAGVSTAVAETFNHSFVHCYSDAILHVLSECSHYCTEEEGAFLKSDIHNFWQVIDTIGYLCKGNRPVSLSFIMNWTDVNIHLSGSGSGLGFMLTYKERAEMIGSTLKCLDHHINTSPELVEADEALRIYITLLSLAKFSEQNCVLNCKTVHESDTRRAQVDILYSTSYRVAFLDYTKLKYRTLPYFCNRKCSKRLIDIPHIGWSFAFFLLPKFNGAKIVCIVMISLINFYYGTYSDIVLFVEQMVIIWLPFLALQEIDYSITPFAIFIYTNKREYIEMVNHMMFHEYGLLVLVLKTIMAWIIIGLLQMLFSYVMSRKQEVLFRIICVIIILIVFLIVRL